MTREEEYTHIIYSYAAAEANRVFDPTVMKQPHIMRLMEAVKKGIAASYQQTKPVE